MEEAFGLLTEEFRRLKIVCVRQAELIKELTEKREITVDLPFTVPIQCTDAGKLDQSEGPFLRPQQKKVLQGAACNALADSREVMGDMSQDVELKYCPKLDIKYPSSNKNYDFSMNANEKSLHLKTADLLEAPTIESAEGSVSNLYDDYRNTFSFDKIGSVSEQPRANIPEPFLGGRVVLSGSDYPFREKEYSETFSDSEAALVPGSLDSAVIYRSTECASVIFNSPGMSRPPQSPWSPHHLPEDCCAGHEATLNSESSLTSQVCEFCQAVFPAGAATRGDYLVHLTGHIECD
ncbi:TRAF family member-associated NF-kappa-B activator-like [Amblyraja radiata]|uniref:TRAF family member-associated NF-kappa-B activator-like n=1 Tax=Amblyraja radiata TaxID=386614 RepID=UPI001402F5E8|nr:TRAF family member-associated NF-kappa-B activator-like [Amblyraja radiata]